MVGSKKRSGSEAMKLVKGNLEEVREAVKNIRSSDGKPIEPKIEPLVTGLQVWGVWTTMSCEGHQDHGLGFPWVMIQFKYVGKVARILCEWNYRRGKTNPVIWIIEPSFEPRIRPLTEKPLEVLQEDAVKFGVFLQRLQKDFDWSKDWE